MKARSFIPMFGLVVVIALLLQSIAWAKKGGTSILHFMVRATMSGSNATGSVNAKLNQQGNADNQQLTIAAANLQSNTTYNLLALIGDDTNLAQVVSFDTDSNGAAFLNYSHIGSSHGRGHGHGDPLPAALNPISDIRSLVVQDTSTQEVLSADLTSPNSIQYLVKRSMSNDGAEPSAAASLRIHASNNAVQFRIVASGLSVSNAYFLSINDAIAAAFTSDAAGHLGINALPGGSPDILDIHQLAILNSSSNSVLSTTLP